MFEKGKLKELTPFGVVLQGSDELERYPISELKDLVAEHKLLVLRGFAPLAREKFISYARLWGPLLEWNFGEVLELEVATQPKNYLFTSGDVPLHWDGAFAEQEPHLQLFQCLRAPLSDCGGETVFCDAMAPLERACRETLQLWKNVRITYRTEKLAHYGGEIVSPLVTKAPSTGVERLRFAEPPGPETSELNPLQLEIEGAGPELIEQLQEVLYHEHNSYRHIWQDGDFLVADNFALLHGRRPFSAHSPRHIQRIHILQEDV